MFRDTNPIYEFRGPWGVPVQIGASIILLPLILIDFGAGTRAFAFDLMFVAILLGSIFLHELGPRMGLSDPGRASKAHHDVWRRRVLRADTFGLAL